MRVTPTFILLGLLAAPAIAQDFERPPDWKVRFDRPASESDLYFVSMPPGWHITTGPSGIFYDPARVAQGEYRVESEIFLFPEAPREGFGIFVGGANLETENQQYLYFLIRKDGSYLIKHRAGSDTHDIIPWTVHDAIVKHPGGGEQVKNVLAIECGPTEVSFFVNGERVSQLPRTEIKVDGVVGLRVNHGLNVHVTSLSIEPREPSE